MQNQKSLNYSEALSEVNKLEGKMNEYHESFWCIVTYVKEGTAPLYYCGYYKNYNGETELKPVLSHNFNDALKLHSKQEAVRIKQSMGKLLWKVEEHAYM